MSFTFPTAPTAPTPISQPQPGGQGQGGLQQALAGSSFTFADTVVRPRLVMSVEGLDGCGKTHLAFTAPTKNGMLYMGTDIGTEGVADKFEPKIRARGHLFGKAEYALVIPNGSSPNAIQDLAQVVWAREARDFEIAVRSGASTIIADTATEIWSHLVLARFGKLNEVPPNLWGIPNSEYVNLMRQVFNSNTNLILLHKQKKEYKGRDATGNMKRAGFTDTNYLVQVAVLMTKVLPGDVVTQDLYPILGPLNKLAQDFRGVVCTEKVFLGRITKCRHNTQLEGQVFVNPDFRTIAMAVMPEIDPRAWE